ncbi:MAG: glycosyltransferase family 4 protein [Polyangiales bacterium]|nr:glycosyltransferase family 4 protein [Myxococcales bacterium]MCB9660310.1 glycosyltransferase family 4 protein [Sandaracinaceae bacterium]
MNISMPVIRNGTGADVYFERLAAGLRGHGHDVSLDFYPRRYEASARWLAMHYKVPEAARVVHTKAEHGFALATRGRPLVMTLAHSVFDPLLVPHKTAVTKAYHRLLKRPSIQRSLARASAVVTVSEHSRQRIQQDFDVRDVVTIYNGVDETRFRVLDEGERTFRERWDKDRFKLFYVGNRMKRKGSDLLEPIMRELGDDFVLYYTAGLRGEHERVASNMVALPRLTDDEMVAAYNECDALLFPSRMEGFGYPVAEAMACGKPVVCSNSSSMPELVEHGHGGRLCPVDDVRAFADAVRDLAGTTPSERARMGAFNRQRVLDSFTNERSVQQYEALYRKLLGEG